MSNKKESFKNPLWEQWGYQISGWIEKLQSVPIQLIKTSDLSRPYEMSSCHLFKLENGRYAVIVEEGCSCYRSEDAEIDIFPDKKVAMEAFKVWEKSKDYRRYE